MTSCPRDEVIVLIGGQKLDHELLSFDSGTGQITVWVEIPAISSSTDTEIDVYYDVERQEIKPVVEDLIAGKLPMISDDQVCGGGGAVQA